MLGPGGVDSPSGGVLTLLCPSCMTLDKSLTFAEPQGLTGSPELCQLWGGWMTQTYREPQPGTWEGLGSVCRRNRYWCHRMEAPSCPGPDPRGPGAWCPWERRRGKSEPHSGPESGLWRWDCPRLVLSGKLLGLSVFFLRKTAMIHINLVVSLGLADEVTRRRTWHMIGPL